MIEITFDAKELKTEIERRVSNASEEALEIASNTVLSEMDKAFDNEGKRPGHNVQWSGTSLIALLKRKTAPKGGTLSQRIASVMQSNPKTLVDTGQMRKSLSILQRIKRGLGFTYLLGASDKKIITHELGGEIAGNEVPTRENQFLTQRDVKEVTDIFKETFKRL